MNQILNGVVIKPTHKNKTFFKIEIIISFFLLFSCFFYYVFNFYYNSKEESISKELINKYNITKLYAINGIENNTYIKNDAEFSIIGIINIEKININYPILSKTTDELLKIAPCKFAGPDANTIGNLCIASHNYNNSTFFSKISNLENNDIITITDIYGKKLNYSVFSKYETAKNDTSCINPISKFSKEITLITCNNTNQKRIIVKAINLQ